VHSVLRVHQQQRGTAGAAELLVLLRHISIHKDGAFLILLEDSSVDLAIEGQRRFVVFGPGPAFSHLKEEVFQVKQVVALAEDARNQLLAKAFFTPIVAQLAVAEGTQLTRVHQGDLAFFVRVVVRNKQLL
jgi:hypothetical protein